MGQEPVSYTHLDVYKRQDNTIPAIPDMVSAAWKDERIPSVKKKFSTKAPLAIIPGMNPYIEHI